MTKSYFFEKFSGFLEENFLFIGAQAKTTESLYHSSLYISPFKTFEAALCVVVASMHYNLKVQNTFFQNRYKSNIEF